MFTRKDLLSKRYEFLEALKYMVNDKRWNKAARNALGLWRGVPDGIKQLRELLNKLPPRDFNIMTQEDDVNSLFKKTMKLLEKKQKSYIGYGKRLGMTQEFYGIAYMDGLNIDNATQHYRKVTSSE